MKLVIEDLSGECISSFGFDPIDIEDISSCKTGLFKYNLKIVLKDSSILEVNDCNKRICDRMKSELMLLKQIRRMQIRKQ